MGTPGPARHIDLTAWSRAHAILMLGSVAVVAALHEPWPIAMLGGLSFIALIGKGVRRFGSLSGLGLANAVTAFRLLLTLAMVSVLHGSRGIVLASTAGIVLILDGLDGYLARRLGLSSDFGAHFDMETDAFLVLASCIELWQRGDFGAWILTAGLLRYLYVLAVLAAPSGEMPRSRWARHVFVLLLVALCVALAFPGTIGTLAGACGTLAMTLSFGRSALWSYRSPATLR